MLFRSKPRLQALAKRAGDRASVTPSVSESRRSARFEFKSNKAYITLVFSVAPDREVKSAVVSWDHTMKVTQDIIKAATAVRKDIFFLCHGGPINTPEDADKVLKGTDCVGFVGASSLERMGVEESLTGLTRKFKTLKVQKK